MTNEQLQAACKGFVEKEKERRNFERLKQRQMLKSADEEIMSIIQRMPKHQILRNSASETLIFFEI